MQRDGNQLQQDARGIWQAGVDAVDSRRLVAGCIRVEDDGLSIAQRRWERGAVDRIVVVGAGKAGAGMAAGVEEALGPAWLDEKQVAGWINVPADCVRPLQSLTLHAARPAGHNEPTSDGVRGAERIVELVESLGPRDLCLCLLSGGGSALLPAPVEGVSLEDKQALTRHLSAAGANIAELNTVRKQLSRIKGGGLARCCRAGTLVTLIISDVIGDPLDIIASGPTVPDPGTPQQALAVLEKFGARSSGASPAVWRHLEAKSDQAAAPPPCETVERVIGNNETAVRAAAEEAQRRGYVVHWEAAQELEGAAEAVGVDLARRAIRMRAGDEPHDCLITGGEPTVELAPAEIRGKGGRNQHLVLAALRELLAESGSRRAAEACARIAVLSGGTDGEDGPTDAAGAWIGALAGDSSLDPGDVDDALRRSDAYHFFQAHDALLRTGPTHTNVCDVRVVTVGRGSR